MHWRQWRVRDAALGRAHLAGTGALVLALKALLANPHSHPNPVNSDA
jgi:hypothetical protein